MSRTRPYRVRLQGKTRMVEATSREQAIGHVTKPLVDECKAANAKEVMEFARGGGTIETAGVYPEPERPLPLRRPTVDDVVIPLAPGLVIEPGDGIVKDGETWRRATEEDADVVRVPEGAVQAGEIISWTPAPPSDSADAPEGC